MILLWKDIDEVVSQIVASHNWLQDGVHETSIANVPQSTGSE
jgi:hypothetical protein